MTFGEQTKSTTLGNTGLAVPKLCFGTACLGGMPHAYGYDVDADRARETVRMIFDGPVNFLDTAREYGDGRSERIIGDVIRDLGGLPDGFVISTKLGRDMASNRFDAAQARRSLEESLAALALDRLQLAHLHDPEYARPRHEIAAPGGALDALFAMKAEGLVETVGLAAGDVDFMMPLLRDWDFDAVITHNRFNLVNRNAEALIEFAAVKGIAVLNAAPYCSGVLAKGSKAYPRYVYRDATAVTLPPIRQIEAICERHDVPVGAAALQFSMRDPRIASTICGISRPERIRQTLNWALWPIPDAAWNDLMALPFATDNPDAGRVVIPD